MVATRELAALGKRWRGGRARRRVFAGSMALRLGRVENRFNAAAQSRGGFRLRLPKRLQNGRTAAVSISSTGRERSGAA